MPRRSGHNSEESPVPRRTSARIAAVQAASPAKSPVKSPRRKRQSAEPNKVASEDTESQQSQLKSEGSIEEMNGLETSSSTKDRDSISDSHELPLKKAKVDDHPSEETVEKMANLNEMTPSEVREPTPTKSAELREPTPTKSVEVREPTPTKPTEVREPTPTKSAEVRELTPTKSAEVREPTPTKPAEVREPTPTKPMEVSELAPEASEEVCGIHTPEGKPPVTEAPIPLRAEAIDFQVVEKTDVPPADSAEVKAAVSVQGEDGQLLVGFVQVDKDELPSATSLEVKHVTYSEQPADHTMGHTLPDAPTVHAPAVNSVNGDSKHTVPSDVMQPEDQHEHEFQSKLPAVIDTVVQPSSTPAAGDGTVVDAISPEAIPQ